MKRLLIALGLMFIPGVALGADVLIGNSDIELGSVGIAAGYERCVRYQALHTGTVETLNIYIPSSLTFFVLGIYAESAGNTPGALLAQSGPWEATGYGWNSCTITATNITEGTYYWLAFTGAATLNHRYGSAGYNCAIAGECSWPNLSNPFSDYNSMADRKVSIYGEGTAATFTPTATPVVTDTPTATPSDTPDWTDTPTATPSDTPDWTDTPTATPSDTPDWTDTPTATPSDTPDWTDTPTATPVVTDTPTATPSDTPDWTDTPTATPSDTPDWTDTPTATPVVTDTPTATPADTATITPTPCWYYEPFDSLGTPADWVEKYDIYTNSTFTVRDDYPGVGSFYRSGGDLSASAIYRLDKSGASALTTYGLIYKIINDWGNSIELRWFLRYNDEYAAANINKNIYVTHAYGGGPYRTYICGGGSTTTHTAYTADGVIKTNVAGPADNIQVQSYFNDGLVASNSISDTMSAQGSIGFYYHWYHSVIQIDDIHVCELTMTPTPTTTPTATPTVTSTATPTVTPTATPSDFGDISSKAPISYGYDGATTTTFWGQYVSRLYALADATGSSPTVSVNWQNGNVQFVTLSHDYTATISLSGGVAGGRYALILLQDGTGSRVVDYTISGVKWAGGTEATQTTTADKKDVIKFLYDGADYLAIGEVDY